MNSPSGSFSLVKTPVTGSTQVTAHAVTAKSICLHVSCVTQSWTHHSIRVVVYFPEVYESRLTSFERHQSKDQISSSKTVFPDTRNTSKTGPGVCVCVCVCVQIENLPRPRDLNLARLRFPLMEDLDLVWVILVPDQLSHKSTVKFSKRPPHPRQSRQAAVNTGKRHRFEHFPQQTATEKTRTCDTTESGRNLIFSARHTTIMINQLNNRTF